MANEYEAQLGELVNLLRGSTQPTVGGDPLATFLTGLGAGMMPGTKSTELILGLANRDRDIRQQNLKNQIAAAEVGGLLEKKQREQAGQEALGQFAQGDPVMAGVSELARVSPDLAMRLMPLMAKREERQRAQAAADMLAQELGLPPGTPPEVVTTLWEQRNKDRQFGLSERSVRATEANAATMGALRGAALEEKQAEAAAFPIRRQAMFDSLSAVVGSLPPRTQQLVAPVLNSIQQAKDNTNLEQSKDDFYRIINMSDALQNREMSKTAAQFDKANTGILQGMGAASREISKASTELSKISQPGLLSSIVGTDTKYKTAQSKLASAVNNGQAMAVTYNTNQVKKWEALKKIDENVAMPELLPIPVYDPASPTGYREISYPEYLSLKEAQDQSRTEQMYQGIKSRVSATQKPFTPGKPSKKSVMDDWS